MQRATDPRIAKISIISANTEYSYHFSGNTARIQIQSRQGNDIRVAFDTGKVAASTDPYYTLKAGTVYFEQGLNTGARVYVAGTGGDVAEILYWL